MSTQEVTLPSSDRREIECDESMVKDGKNAQEICCELCGSVVLRIGQSSHTKKQIFLPHMKKKSESADPADGETLEDFWLVNDMFTFENVGFSNTVGTTKYLICADCEIGPIGWHDVTDKKAFYIAVDRVRHVVK